MIVLVTGVTGFLGSRFAAALAARGYHVVGAASTVQGLETPTPGVARKVLFRLDEALTPGIVRGIDAIVHCAWIAGRAGANENVAGTRRLVEAAEAAGAAYQVFVSTVSAHSEAVSNYGRSKLAVQEYMLARGHACVRPGLVVGPGGIFQRLVDVVTRSAVVPLVDGGRGRVPVLALEDAQRTLVQLVERKLTGPFNLFSPDPVTLRDVVLEICAAQRRRPLVIPVPSTLLLGLTVLAERLGLTLPLDAENVRGWRANLGVLDASDLLTFVPAPLTLAEMVREAVRGASPPGDRR